MLKYQVLSAIFKHTDQKNHFIKIGCLKCFLELKIQKNIF